MRLSQISIERPVLASVMSLIIVLFGWIGATRLQNRELPDVDPPVVSVTTVFPGAAPEVVETSVTQPLEDLLVGVEGVKHITSTSREQVSQVSIEFTLDRDIEDAANDVRDRVARSRRQLPDEIDDPVVAKRDSDSSPVLWAALSSDRLDQVELTRIAELYIKDRIGKLPGVSTVLIAGERRYSMRVWIDNNRLTAHDLTVADVAAALQRQNVDIPSGRIEGTDREFTVRSLGELRTEEAYRRLVVSPRSGSEPVRLGDVARVEGGPEDERKIVRFNGVAGLGLGVVKQSKANTLDVANVVRSEIDEIRKTLPPGVKIEPAYDSSIFIRQSIESVRHTIYEAVLLVILVIYCFLRSARATLIPAAAIPVSVIGAFMVLYVLGFTINTLTLMGITLAIGLVVDDAIVVVENITRWMEEGSGPVEAARRGMEEISFAVISATIATVAVFLPLTFLTDTTGRLFREFAVTVAAAVAVSGFVALTLSPALCALVVRKGGVDSSFKQALARTFDAPARLYGRVVGRALAVPALWIGVGLVWVLLGALLFRSIDQELVPTSDRGSVLAKLTAPEGSTIEYTDRYQRQAEAIFLRTPEVERVFSVVSLGIGTPGLVNEGFIFSMLKPKSERARPQRKVVAALNRELRDVAGVRAFAFEPRPLGSSFLGAPVSMVIEGQDLHELARRADEMERRLGELKGFSRTESDLFLNKPQLDVSIDRDRASDLDVSVREVAQTLQILLGGRDLSTFKLDGETYDVMVQLEREERTRARQLMDLYVRNGEGRLIPLRSVVEAQATVAPRALPHYDRFRAVTVSARLEDGFSQKDALDAAAAVAADVVPPGGGYQVAWTGDAEKFFEAGNSLAFAYLLAILVVYLVLSAQFESFVHPITILVAVALSFTGALLGLEIVTGWRKLHGLTNPMTLNLYSKIGLVMLVGLVTKNSILIVEFANQLRERGMALREATLEACRIRFRPILMTALSTIAGLVPIAAGWGAGGESRQPLGVSVVGGVFFATFLSFFVVPAVYLQIEGFRERLRGRAPAASRAQAPGVAGGR